MGSDAEVAEDVLWNTELPIINTTRAGRAWSDWPSEKLRKLGSVPLMGPIAPFWHYYFPQHFIWAPICS